MEDYDVTSGERRGSAAVQRFAGQAAARAQKAAAYFRGREMKDVWADVRRYVISHPGPALAAAVATGVIAGRLLRRR